MEAEKTFAESGCFRTSPTPGPPSGAEKNKLNLLGRPARHELHGNKAGALQIAFKSEQDRQCLRAQRRSPSKAMEKAQPTAKRPPAPVYPASVASAPKADSRVSHESESRSWQRLVPSLHGRPVFWPVNCRGWNDIGSDQFILNFFFKLIFLLHLLQNRLLRKQGQHT